MKVQNKTSLSSFPSTFTKPTVHHSTSLNKPWQKPKTTSNTLNNTYYTSLISSPISKQSKMPQPTLSLSSTIRTNQIINPHDLLEQKSQKQTIDTSTYQWFQSLSQPSDQLLSWLNSAFEAVESTYQYLSDNEKIESFTHIASNPSNSFQLRLGAMIAIYLWLSKQTCAPSQTLIDWCFDIVYNYKDYFENFLIISIDILSYINNQNLWSNSLNILSLFLTDDNFPNIQTSAFNCLFRMGYTGIKTLIDIARDYPMYQKQILNRLIATPHIQSIIVVKYLVSELNSKNYTRIYTALLALNYWYDIVGICGDKIELHISELFNDKKVNKAWVASVLRTSGRFGEDLLCGIAKNHSDFAVRSACVRVFGWKWRCNKSYLKVKINYNNVDYIRNKEKGILIEYHGSEYPVFSEQSSCWGCENSNDDSYVTFYSEDIMACLHRMISQEHVHDSPILSTDGKTLDSIFGFHNWDLVNNAKHFYPLNQHIDEMVPDKSSAFSTRFNGDLNSDLYPISKKVIASLCNCLKDKSSSVRHVTIITLGLIGFPVASTAVSHLLPLFTTERESNIVSALLETTAIWASVKNISYECIVTLLNKYLFSVNPALQSASIQWLPLIINDIPKNILTHLTSTLLGASVNKITYAKAWLLLNEEGEEILIDLLRTKNDYKLQSSIILAFSHVNPHTSNIDFIFETLLSFQNSPSALVRKNIWLTFAFWWRSYDNICTLLNNKNILSIYYNNLNDFDEQVGRLCLQQMVLFKAKGEWMLIQGAMKDKSENVRMLCIEGWAELGVHNLRTWLVCLIEEKNEGVRSLCQKVILKKFKEEDVVQYYQECEHKESFTANWRDIMDFMRNKWSEKFIRFLDGVNRRIV